MRFSLIRQYARFGPYERILLFAGLLAVLCSVAILLLSVADSGCLLLLFLIPGESAGWQCAVWRAAAALLLVCCVLLVCWSARHAWRFCAILLVSCALVWSGLLRALQPG